MAEKIQGGCLCGTVRFELEPEFIMYRYCFCSRCRKVRGTIHAANLFVEPHRFAWLAGEDRVNCYTLEGARFGNCFCTQCGSPVPRQTQGGKSMLIPAGSLDTDPGSQPECAIFWDSRVAWLPVADALEKRLEY